VWPRSSNNFFWKLKTKSTFTFKCFRVFFVIFGFFFLGVCTAEGQPYSAPLYRSARHRLALSANQQDFKWHGALSGDLKYLHDTIAPKFLKPYLHSDKDFGVWVLPILELSGSLVAPDQKQTAGIFGGGISAGWRFKKIWAGQINISSAQGSYQRHTQRQALLGGISPEGQLYAANDGGILHHTDINGYLNLQAGKYIVLGLGHGRHFIGEGYRSFFLSDYAGNQSYGHITATFWRLKYKVLYSQMRDLRGAASSKYTNLERKYSTTHYLSWNVAKWLNLGLFESVVWRGDDTLHSRGFDANYLNPVILMRPSEYALGSSDNVLLGGAVHLKPTQKTVIYSQLMLDEFLISALRADIKHALNPTDTTIQWGWWANKYAVQVGARHYGLFGIKNIGLQAEFNFCRPFTYSHSDPMSNYGHLGRPLAHPLGANFKELLGLVNYTGKRWFGEGGIIVQELGTDDPGINGGTDIYASYQYRKRDYRHYTGQHQTAYVTQIFGRISWIIIPHTHLRIFAEARLRRQLLQGVDTRDGYLELGITSRVFGRVRDN
jgi:hypothetical protein